MCVCVVVLQETVAEMCAHLTCRAGLPLLRLLAPPMTYATAKMAVADDDYYYWYVRRREVKKSWRRARGV